MNDTRMLFEQLQRKSVKHIREEENIFFNYFYTCTVFLGERYNFNVRKLMICHVVYTNILQHCYNFARSLTTYFVIH